MSATRRLVLAWVVMSGLTLAAIFVGHAQSQRSIGVWLAGALIAMTFAKAAILLSEYLDLRHAPAWNRGLRLSLFVLLAILLGLSAAAL